MQCSYRFLVLIEQDEDGMYVASVPALRGCHTQAQCVEELLPRVREAIELCLETVVPAHSGEDLGRGLLRSILRDIEIPREEFLEWL